MIWSCFLLSPYYCAYNNAVIEITVGLLSRNIIAETRFYHIYVISYQQYILIFTIIIFKSLCLLYIRLTKVSQLLTAFNIIPELHNFPLLLWSFILLHRTIITETFLFIR